MSTITPQQYADLCAKVQEDFSVISGKLSPLVKYMDCSFDLRDGKIFSIRVRGLGWDECFHVMNEQREIPTALDARILTHLTERHEKRVLTLKAGR